VAVVRNASAAERLGPLVAQGHVSIVEADMTKPDTFEVNFSDSILIEPNLLGAALC
jgi:uncharacterized protein YbjT (DUF2867 family)